MEDWKENEIMFTKNAPTKEDLDVIEKDIEELINETKSDYNKKQVTSNIEPKCSIKLTQFELECIEEMERIINDPKYISPTRLKRLANLEDEDQDVEVQEVSFDEPTFSKYHQMMGFNGFS